MSLYLYDHSLYSETSLSGHFINKATSFGGQLWKFQNIFHITLLNKFSLMWPPRYLGHQPLSTDPTDEISVNVPYLDKVTSGKQSKVAVANNYDTNF